MPPVPVLVPDAGARALEPQLEREVRAFSAGAAPNVTYWLEPFSCSGLVGAALLAWAEASVEASDWLFAKSTAVTT